MSDDNGEILTLNGHPNNLLSLCLANFIDDQKEWSEQPSPNGFGPGCRREGVCKHIESELAEIRSAKPGSLELLIEWCDVVILALDGAWRSGFTASMICQALLLKTKINHSRKWPASPPDQPSMHVKTPTYTRDERDEVAWLLKDGTISAGKACEMLGIARADLSEVMAPYELPEVLLHEDDLKPIPGLGGRTSDTPPPPQPLTYRDVCWMGHTCYLVYWVNGDNCQVAPDIEEVRELLFTGAATQWDCDIPTNAARRREVVKFVPMSTNGAVMAYLDCSRLFPVAARAQLEVSDENMYYDPLPPEPGTGPDWWCCNCKWCNSDLRQSCRYCHVNRVQNGVDTSYTAPPNHCADCGVKLASPDASRCLACTEKREG